MYVSMYMNAQKHEGRLYTSQNLFFQVFFYVTYCDTCVNIRELILKCFSYKKQLQSIDVVGLDNF